MDTLQDVMRAIGAGPRAETRRRDHLTVFREFLDHLDRAARRRAPARSARSKARRSRK